MSIFKNLKYRLDMDIVGPVKTLLGYSKLKKISLKSDLPQWNTSFYNANVLIVGTGPSLDKVEAAYFSKFDTIIYLNHAIKLASKLSDEYYFSTDAYVTKDIELEPYIQNIYNLGPEKSILAPIHFQSLIEINKQFLNRFSLISANQASYKSYESSIKNIKYHRYIYWPVQPDYHDLEKWFSQNEQTLFFPVVESTSALSAILFAAKYRPKSISLIGCDFSKGRSNKLIESNPSRDFNPFNEARDKFKFLQNYLNDKNIKVINDSWNFN